MDYIRVWLSDSGLKSPLCDLIQVESLKDRVQGKPQCKKASGQTMALLLIIIIINEYYYSGI